MAEEIKLTGVRKAMVSHMTKSWTGVPQFHLTIDINCKELLDFRANNDEKYSLTVLISYLIGQALINHPIINSSLSEKAIKLHDNINIGIAVASERGLLVPVIKEVNAMNFTEFNEYFKEHILKSSKKGRFSLEDLSGGTITISNLGMYGITDFNSIVNEPETCIISIPAFKKEVKINQENEIEEVTILSLTGNFDHRVITGEDGANFLAEIKQIVESSKTYENLV